MKTQGFHEDLGRQDKAGAGSERSFGMVFAVVFGVIALWPVFDGGRMRAWAAAVAAFFFIAGLLMPPVLQPLNRLWFLFGAALHRIVSPLIMGLLFYLTVTPIALIMRIVGKDPLRLKFDRAARSYWIERHPAGPAPETMRRQF
jgi:hypothetical protein